MSSEWKEILIGEAEIHMGDGNYSSKYPKASDFVDAGVPFISAGDFVNGRISPANFRYISQEQHSTLKKGQLKSGDVLIVSRGNGVGQVAFVDAEFEDCNINAQLVLLRCDNEQIKDSYLYYLLSSSKYQRLMQNYTSGSAQPQFTNRAIKQIPVRIPPLQEQKRIAHILGTLDDKIELNRKMNETLEAMAQALFKSWFVDFDPVIDNALVAGNPIPEPLQKKADKRKGAKKGKFNHLFPSTFTFNETLNKWIPEGWELKSFGDFYDCLDSKRIPLSKKQREEKKPGTYPYYGATSINDYINEYIFDDTFLLLGEDGSVMKEDGTPFTQYVWGKMWVNNHAHVLKGKNGISTEHLLNFIKRENINAYVTGAVQLKINQGNMKRIPFLYSSNEINHEFGKQLDILYKKIKNSTEEIESLTKTRDTVLPKLISGKIIVQ